MQWIRENLFLACLIGALVACAGVVYTVRSGQDTDFVDKDMFPRVELADRIYDLDDSEPVNKDRMAKAQRRLDRIRRQLKTVVRDATEWNRKNYGVLQLKATGSGAVETIPAFPYNSAVYQTKDLTSKFTNTYRIVIYGALAKLDLTSWPTGAEIDELSLKIESDIQSKRKAAVRRVEYAQRNSGTAAPKPPAGADKPKEEVKKPKGISQEDWDLSRYTDADVRKMARRNATEELMIQKANAGIMYVSPKTLAMVSDLKLPGADVGPEELDVVFPKEVWQSSDAPPTMLWEAQLNLWVTQDILGAIDATNQRSLRTAGSVRKATVPNAAIKLLSGIDIAEQYMMRRGKDSAGKTNANITSRVTTKEYEIIEYELLVVMKTAYLPVLMRNLMMRGDHTITAVSVEQLLTGPDGMRYYGTDPVANVRLVGEVLFRSDWTRKIMPLETLRGRLGGVLRPEDEKRLQDKDK
ncbi:MAG: hypothetical protein QGH60_09490 [Phycisphaerae bacterium]|jgi:hypothetical protein|nr:hypothetical protein [Phycisphaerae bacterium]